MHKDQQKEDRQRRRMARRSKGANQKPLSECKEDTTHIIIDNSDKQSMEMGLFGGATVRVIRNSIGSPNMVVGVGDSRYMLSKDTALKILVG